MFIDILKLFALLLNIVLRIACLIVGFFVVLMSMNYVEESTLRFIATLFFGVWLTFQSVTKNGPYKILFMIGALFGWVFGTYK